MQRNRLIYFTLIIITIILGLLSRKNITPEIVYPYLGDYLYAIMFFLMTGFLFSKKDSSKVALISILLCYLIELSQLYQAEWINNIRSYRLGALILGHGFLWSDIISYTFGGITGYLIESFFLKEINSKKSI